HRRGPLFPYTTLFRSARGAAAAEDRRQLEHEAELALRAALVLAQVADQVGEGEEIDRADQMHAPEAHLAPDRVAREEEDGRIEQDRKSTRLNSSHLGI